MEDNWLHHQQSYEDHDQLMIDSVNLNYSTLNPTSQIKTGQSSISIDLDQRYDILYSQNNQNALVTPANTLIKEINIAPLSHKDTINQTIQKSFIETRVKDMKTSSLANDNVILMNNLYTFPSNGAEKRISLGESVKKNIRSKYKTKEMIYQLKTCMANYRTNRIHVNDFNYLEL